MISQRRGERTRSRILQAAEDCFAQRGYDAASVAEICRSAGVSKGAFYHHFPSKQALFLELLDRWLAELDAQLDDFSALAFLTQVDVYLNGVLPRPRSPRPVDFKC